MNRSRLAPAAVYVLAAGGFATAIGFARPAAAQAESPYTYTWFQDTTLGVSPAGCATKIVVAPNNVPFVLGCTGPNSKDRDIYYLQTSSSCVDGFCYPTSKWVYTDFAGETLSADADGDVYTISSTNGQAYYLNFTVAAPAVPANTWTDLTTTNNNDLPVGTTGLANGCLSNLVALTDGGGESFVTGQTFGFVSAYSYWGLGCGSAENQPYVENQTIGATTWSTVGTTLGVQLAIFNDFSQASGSTQTVWMLDGNLGVWQYNAEQGQFVQEPGDAFYLTDHFAIGIDTSWQWAEFQWNDSSQNWDLYSIGQPPSGVPIVSIAYASQRVTDYGTFGPSQLWGVDSLHHIYYAGPTPYVAH